MRIIKVSFLRQMEKKHPTATSNIEAWIKITKAAKWKDITQLKKVFPGADSVTVKSKRTVIVFNICKTNFRLIAAVHFNRKRVYALRFLTHAEYDKNNWKKEL